MERIQQQAAVSRGALTHHFGSMPDLLVASVEEIARRHGDELERALSDLNDDDPTDVLVDSLHRMMQRPVFLAGLELWVAARTDPTMQPAVAQSARAASEGLRAAITRALGPDLTPAQQSVAYDGLMAMLRGLGLGSVIRDRPEREREILRLWLQQFHAARPEPVTDE